MMLRKYIATQREKARLITAFRSGSLYTKYGDKPIYPAIQDVRFLDGRTQYVFTIPVGLDPAKVTKHYVFAQVFGDNIEMVRCGNTITLTAYHEQLPSHWTYDFDRIKPHIQRMRLPIIVGQSNHGIEAYDMTEWPHLLIAGETGSGKSTQVRAVLTTLMLAKRPDELRLFLADMKRSEFHVFKRVAHVEASVVDVDSLLDVLYELQTEMQQRGDMLDAEECAHIDDLAAEIRPPYIVLCIDEVALLKGEKEAMNRIEEISALGRALGVFLILSMQRPDADVLDGKLKHNLTVRMAFRHSDEINSRITLGSGEAASIPLANRGRMYWKGDGLRLVQGPYLSVEQARRLLVTIKTKTAEIKRAKPGLRPTQPDRIFGILDGGAGDA